MTSIDLTELARNGDASAIATLLSQALQIQRQALKVDWQGGYLNIRLIAAHGINRAQLVTALQLPLLIERN